MLKLAHVVGARPNFMKAAPLVEALAARPGITQVLVHTGQHYDANMSDIFFQQLGLRAPDVNLEAGSGSQTVQTARIMMRFEEVLAEHRPDIVVVYGDVNSTVAAALVCAKHRVPIAHVEAGLRSFDRSMPEEINRLMTDQVADWLFTPSPDGDANLRREGVDPARIHFVGNIMIDTLVRLLPLARPPEGLALEDRYLLVTLHRPSNVDDPEMLRRIVTALDELSAGVQVIFPIHPRTRQRLAGFAWQPSRPARFLLREPAGYLEFLALQKGAAAIVTDSGGIQEESTFLRVPCLTLRENTERPVTVETGTNQLLGRDLERLKVEVSKVLAGAVKQGRIPDLWDGQTAGRIAAILAGN